VTNNIKVIALQITKIGRAGVASTELG